MSRMWIAFFVGPGSRAPGQSRRRAYSRIIAVLRSEVGLMHFIAALRRGNACVSSGGRGLAAVGVCGTMRIRQQVAANEQISRDAVSRCNGGRFGRCSEDADKPLILREVGLVKSEDAGRSVPNRVCRLKS